MKYELITYPDPLLRTPCTEVTFPDSDLLELISSMRRIMVDNVGMGISANQVGSTKRIAIVDATVLINPVIISKDILIPPNHWVVEGCLSFPPDVVGTVEGRYSIVEVRYQDINGIPNTCTFSGIRAVCVQHEIDHLNGIVFVDGFKNSTNVL